MAETEKCRHAGSVQWNPFKMAVLCATCGEVFYRAVLTDEGYVLRHIGSLESGCEELVEGLAAQLFGAVRSSGEWSVVEKPIFMRMARRALQYLVEKAKNRPENPSNP
jgi:hypothetical protein